MKTLSESLLKSSERLLAVAGDRAMAEARMLHSKVLQMDPVQMIAQPHQQISDQYQNQIEALVTRRLQNEPMAYILGTKDFLDFRFEVGAGVLIPRPETESLVLEISDWIRKQNRSVRVIDLGAGSGCIGLSIKKMNAELVELHLLERSALAMEFTKKNAENLGLQDVQFHHRSWTSPVEIDFDVIVSNPPYIPDSQWEPLSKDIKDHEPKEALTAGPEGLDAYQEILKFWWPRLAADGLMAFETYDSLQRSKILSMLPRHKSHWEFEAHLFILKH
jgi:release factor glutamine methyltransferase